MWKAIATQTEREKKATLDGVNLFFGALLGANLGTVGGLDPVEYGVLITMLAGTVITLHIFTSTERRRNAWLLLGVYALLLAYVFTGRSTLIEGLADEQRVRFGITFLVWIGSILMAEFMPLLPSREDEAGTKTVAAAD